jgi:hypothetical protein
VSLAEALLMHYGKIAAKTLALFGVVAALQFVLRPG